MWHNRSLGCVRLCVCVCVCVCVTYLLHRLYVLERSYVVLSSNCCMYMCLLRRGHVLGGVFDTRWLLHWPGLVSK